MLCYADFCDRVWKTGTGRAGGWLIWLIVFFVLLLVSYLICWLSIYVEVRQHYLICGSIADQFSSPRMATHHSQLLSFPPLPRKVGNPCSEISSDSYMHGRRLCVFFTELSSYKVFFFITVIGKIV